MNPIMMLLSTSRQSDEAIEFAIRKSAPAGNLSVIFIVDINLECCLIESDGLFPALKEKCEEVVLKHRKKDAEEKIRSIMKIAGNRGISIRAYISVEKYGLECIKKIREEKPSVIITAKSSRPDWVKKVLHSPVDYVIANAGCPVLES